MSLKFSLEPLLVLVGCSTTPRLLQTPPLPPPLPPRPALAEEVLVPSITFAWDASPSPGIEGYFLYYGPASRTYTNRWAVGNVTQATIPRPPGTNYYTVTAGDTNGLESDYSNEVSFAEPTTIVVRLQSATNAAGPWQTLSPPAVVLTNASAQPLGFWRLLISRE